MCDVLVAGEINPDLILTGNVEPEFGQVEKLVDGAALSIGSSSAIFACGAARLGLKVGFVGVCGDDVLGHFMLAELQRHGVDISNAIIRPGGKTGLSVILNRSCDRAILTFEGLIPALQASDIPFPLLQQARHVHVASYFLQKGLQADLPALFRNAHSAGLTTSLDTNYDPSGQWAAMGELLCETDIFLPNDAEALSISRADDLETAAQQLAQQVGLVAIKLGSEGGLACQAGRMVRAGAIPVEALDSVGAGDSFDAGFVYGYLNQWPLGESLRLACACGSLSMRERGGTDGQPTLEEALRYVSA